MEFQKIRIECHIEYCHVLDFLLPQTQFLGLRSRLQVFQGQYRFLHRIANPAKKNQAVVIPLKLKPIVKNFCHIKNFATLSLHDMKLVLIAVDLGMTHQKIE